MLLGLGRKFPGLLLIMQPPKQEEFTHVKQGIYNYNIAREREKKPAGKVGFFYFITIHSFLKIPLLAGQAQGL